MHEETERDLCAALGRMSLVTPVGSESKSLKRQAEE